MSTYNNSFCLYLTENAERTYTQLATLRIKPTRLVMPLPNTRRDPHMISVFRHDFRTDERLIVFIRNLNPVKGRAVVSARRASR